MNRRILFPMLIGALTGLPAPAQEIAWHTIDGGGAMQTAGGVFVLSGTLAQPDAGGMSGGSFALFGGFWAAAPVGCDCLGDMNDDGLLDGGDIQSLVGCALVGGAPNCACADVASPTGIDMSDISAFVNDLLTGTTCPS